MKLVPVPARALTAIVAITACLFWPLAGVGVGLPAVTHLQIQGDGSSWAYNALNQWVGDVSSQGLQVVYTSTGSAQGRIDFGNSVVDFADSDIGYQGKDPLTGVADTNNNRQFAYLPVVAGGTSFPYNIEQNGQQVRNLRLSPMTLAQIFTGQITMWSAQAITDDNNGRQLPAIPIIPVVHSEGSGDTAQLTTFFDTDYTSIWRSFIGKSGDAAAPGDDFTEYFPATSADRAENGSDGVINEIGAQGTDGAIGYDEYSYALGKNIPVAKVENAAKYFTLPNQYNVAVALTQAQINMDTSNPLTYLLQKLSNVYTYSDPRTYPLSSYSYVIIPTSGSDQHESTGKRQTLADFLAYSICNGQGEVGPVGYSSLPYNLVLASFAQIDQLHTADPNVDVSTQSPSTCDNPTFDHTNLNLNKLAEIAPQPGPCDLAGAGPSIDDKGDCSAGGPAGSGNGGSGGGANGGLGGGGSVSTSPTTAPAGLGVNQGGPTSSHSTGVPATVAKPGSNAKGSAASVNSANGSGGSDSVTEPTQDAAASPEPTSLADGPASTENFHGAGGWTLLAPLCALLLLIVLLGPSLLGRLFQRFGGRGR